MKYVSMLSFVICLFCIHGCVNAQNEGVNYVLPANEFSAKINAQRNEFLLDVRSPEEFKKGHLADAVNIDWNGDDFAKETDKLDKSTPIYIYCLSGGRSHTAANKLRKNGFEVYEMDGGILQWRSAGLPEIKEEQEKIQSMSFDDFNNLIADDKMVLVDFYAPWCGPCKKMKPFLSEIESDMSSTLKVVRINIDEHPQLARMMKIDAIPVLQIYKDQEMLWTNTGYLDKKGVLKAIAENDEL